MQRQELLAGAVDWLLESGGWREGESDTVTGSRGSGSGTWYGVTTCYSSQLLHLLMCEKPVGLI